MRKLHYIIILLLWFSLKSVAQKTAEFNIYYDPIRYTDSLLNILQKQKTFRTYHLMIQAHIDPKKTGAFDTAAFVANIALIYPDSLATDVLSIDLENALFTNLFNFKKGTPEYQQSEDGFIWMIDTVKAMRPNVKVGVYGLPFRAFYPQSREPDTTKLDAIFSKCDYIFPSLYIIYPDIQVGKARNDQYLTENLQAALAYGARLNKPVLPFVWTAIHPSNKKYGGQLLNKDEFMRIVSFIKNFKYKDARAKGVVCWDPDPIYFANTVKVPAARKMVIPSDKLSKAPISEVFYDYMQSFIKKTR